MKGFKKIPSHAKLVFKGVLHDVYQWQQVMFDGSTSTFEALKRKPSVTIIASTKQGMLLVVDEEQPYNGRNLCLPGGIAESDDLLSEAKRELAEETGYLSNDWQYYAMTDVLNYSKLEWESCFYIARNCSLQTQKKLDPGEKNKVLLCSFQEFIDISQSVDFSNSFLSNTIQSIMADSQRLEEFRKILLG
ncbi:MAG: NUDIX domain-containing protein [Candidatus Saccharibacteria bacterium]|nr:NUDIX domain-containing protein [Candidatus Saccharibacteria bacterium]